MSWHQQSCVTNPGLGMIGSPIVMSGGMDRAELVEKSKRGRVDCPK